MLRRTLLASALLFAAVAVPASAQDMRLRATVEKVDGSTYIVKDRDGVEQKLTTTDQPLYVAIVRVSMADIKPGMFVGSTAMPAADGSLQAVEVHIFPEAMRGTGEGHRPWDLKPQSTMTNATVEQVTSVGDHQITLKYKEGEKKIVVGPECPIVSYAPGNLDDL